MDLGRLRVYVASERRKTAMDTVLVLTDGAERIVLRPGDDAEWTATGVHRLVAGALDLQAALVLDGLPEPVAR